MIDSTDVVVFAAYIVAAYAVGIKIVLLWYYIVSHYRSRLVPRMLIGASHVTLITLTVVLLNFCAFVSETSRSVASVIALVAFVIAALGMTLMVKREHAAHILDLADPSRFETPTGCRP